MTEAERLAHLDDIVRHFLLSAHFPGTGRAEGTTIRWSHEFGGSIHVGTDAMYAEPGEIEALRLTKELAQAGERT